MSEDREKAHGAWRAAERIKRLSDRLVGVGPFGVGLDGVLAWVPFAGTAYSVGAGALLMYHGLMAKASLPTLARMGAYLVLDSAASVPPVCSMSLPANHISSVSWWGSPESDLANCWPQVRISSARQ